MLRFFHIFVCAVSFLCVVTVFAETFPLSDRGGRVINVSILKIEAERIHIRMENGQETWLDRDRLSVESNTLLADKVASEKNRYEDLNEVLGIPLFSDHSLWDDSAKVVADRLKWPQESETNQQSSFRSYPNADYRILDSRPFSNALYGEQKMVQLISLVFANKGDFRFSDPPTEYEISKMEQAIERDEKKIKERLTEQLGEPDRQQFGAGRGIKQLIYRWDWNGHAFLLASKEAEYASLKIMTTTLADSKGRSERLSDAALRQLTVDNLINRENGDVLIGNIPMVNQGPKGYCVPATFERYLRYMQIPADMYILAMAGQTQVGGGTSLSSIIKSIDGYIASQNRSMKKLEEPIKVRTVQKYIDKGLPIIWVMFSSSKYNTYANERTVNRSQVTDWESWKSKTKTESRKIDLARDFTAAHACMITGYNRQTGEIAVSDSWGPKYQERWVSADQAEQVSQGLIYLISF